MFRSVLTFPVLPGKTAQDNRKIPDEFRRRPDEYKESRRRMGVKLERAYLQTTPMGSFVVAYTEGDKPFSEGAAILGQSDLDIDRFFRDAVKELNGFDLTQPPPPGPPPENVIEWVDPDVTATLKGMAFSAPLIPEKAEQGRAFGREVMASPGMTESRRALGQNKEVVTIVETPMGPIASVYLEGDDPFEANRRFAASNSEFDRWFKDQLRELFPPFIDFGQPVPGIEELFDSETL